MEISSFNSSADLLMQQYWGVDELMASVFPEELDEESRPLKQVRTDYSFGSKNCTLNSSRDRNLAERNRRERMSHKFTALSALLPPFKKSDKASILEEAIKHIIQLQKRVDTLEKKIIKSCRNDDGGIRSCSNQSLSVNSQSSLPLIKAKCYNSEVLISIHYERRKGVLENIVGIIEKLYLSVVSCSVVHFGDSDLNITIIAEMEEKYVMSIKEVVNNLHVALKI